MIVRHQDVARITQLARLSFSKDEADKLVSELNQILTYVTKLNQIDTSRVSPLSYVAGTGDGLREDVVQPSNVHDEVVGNSTDWSDEFFRVLKVLTDQ